MTECYTKMVRVDPLRIDNELLDEPGRMLANGDLVAFPTETVYGLGASAFSDESVRKIFRAKGRPNDNPLIVHISDVEMLKSFLSESELRSIPERLNKVMETFWPGPLTILLPKGNKISPVVCAGQPSLAVRIPANEIARRLIRSSGVPIAAPSANTSGMPSPTVAEHVIHDLNGKISCIVDGGSCDIGVESTVIDGLQNPPLILRPGGVSIEELRTVLPNIDIFESRLSKSEIEKIRENPPTPGLKYRHYAPHAKAVLLHCNQLTAQSIHAISTELNRRLRLDIENKQRVGVIMTQKSVQIDEDILDDVEMVNMDCHDNLGHECVVVWELLGEGSEDLNAVSRGLFQALRGLDSYNVSTVYLICVSDKGRGVAIMNRFRKASNEAFCVDGD